MITIFKSTERGLEVIDEVVTGCWINVVDPTADEIEQITALDLPPDFITYPLDIDERARTEREDDGTILLLIRIPVFQGTQVDVPYSTIPLGIIIADRFIVTICRRENDLVQDFAMGRVKNLNTNKRNRFVLRILLYNATRYLNYLREINKIVDQLEDQLTKSMRNKEVHELLKYQKSLVYFATALKSNELLLNRLHGGQFFRMYAEDEDLLEDVIIENQQAIEMVNISSNILAGMMDAFASIISNNLNVVMKFLASVTIVLAIPNIIFSFFGMNVDLPFQQAEVAVLLIIGISLLISLVVVLIFVKKDWF